MSPRGPLIEVSLWVCARWGDAVWFECVGVHVAWRGLVVGLCIVSCLGSLLHDPHPFVLGYVGCVGERVGAGCGVWAGAVVGGVGWCGILRAWVVVATGDVPQSGPLLGPAVTENMLGLGRKADPKSVPDSGPEIGARFRTPHHITYYPGISTATSLVPFPGTNIGAVF